MKKKLSIFEIISKIRVAVAAFIIAFFLSAGISVYFFDVDTVWFSVFIFISVMLAIRTGFCFYNMKIISDRSVDVI
jgi:hypothetical protein